MVHVHGELLNQDVVVVVRMRAVNLYLRREASCSVSGLARPGVSE